MITQQFHPADSVPLIGDSQHGLMDASAEWRRIGAAHFQMRVADSGYQSVYAEMNGDTHLLRVPGGGTVPLTPEQLAAEASIGNVWQDYTLLAGRGLCAHGRILGAPVYVDPTGAPWLVVGGKNLGVVTHGSTFASTITLKPYGRIGEAPAMGREITVSLAAAELGLPTPLPGYLATIINFVLELQSIASDGSEIIYALIPRFGRYVWEYTYAKPAAFWRLTLTGAGAEIMAQLTVLRTLSMTIGNRQDTVTGTQTPSPQFELEATHEVEGPPVDGGQWSRLTLTSVNCTQTPKLRHAGVTGQLLAVLHDDANMLVEISMDAVYDERLWLEGLTWSVDRPHRCYFTYPGGTFPYSEERAHITIGLRMGHESACSLRLYRDGDLIEEVKSVSTTLSDYADIDQSVSGNLKQHFLPGAYSGPSWSGGVSTNSITATGTHSWSQSISGQSGAWSGSDDFARFGDTFKHMQARAEQFVVDSGYGGTPARAHANISCSAPFIRIGATSGSLYTASALRPTNNLAGIVIDVAPTGSGPNPWPLTRYVPIKLVAPRTVITVPAAADDGQTPEIFASYHPLKHEIYAGYVNRTQWQVAPGETVTLRGVNWI